MKIRLEEKLNSTRVYRSRLCVRAVCVYSHLFAFSSARQRHQLHSTRERVQCRLVLVALLTPRTVIIYLFFIFLLHFGCVNWRHRHDEYSRCPPLSILFAVIVVVVIVIVDDGQCVWLHSGPLPFTTTPNTLGRTAAENWSSQPTNIHNQINWHFGIFALVARNQSVHVCHELQPDPAQTSHNILWLDFNEWNYYWNGKIYCVPAFDCLRWNAA